MKIKQANWKMIYAAAVIGLLFWFAAPISAQTTETTPTLTAKTEVLKTEKPAGLQPVMKEYKGVKIGMAADEVREKIDETPKVADKDGFYFVFSDEESAQIVLDADKKVRVISVMYSGNDAKAPKYEEVFGKDVPVVEASENGIYNIVRYPEAGFWVAYNRTAGDKPLTTVTIQKMWNPK